MIGGGKLNSVNIQPINRKHNHPTINVEGDLLDGMSFGLIIGGALLIGLGVSLLE